MSYFTGLIPLGKFAIVAGTTQLLTANLGPQKQSVGGVPARTVRQVIISADGANTGQIFLLPAGQKFSSNPGNVIAAFSKGATVAIPSGVMLGGSLALDSLCFDSDTGTNTVYACAVAG
jgi:hypothetical protein